MIFLYHLFDVVSEFHSSNDVVPPDDESGLLALDPNYHIDALASAYNADPSYALLTICEYLS